MIDRIKSIVRHVQCLPPRVGASLGLYDPGTPLVNFIVEKANWSIRCDGQSITDGVNALVPGTAGIFDEPYRLSNRVIHFGSQYMWTSWGPHMSVSNRYAVTYFHGKPEDGPAAAKNLDQVLDSLPKLDFVITAAKLMEDRLLEWGVPREKLKRIPIGVDTKLFRPPSVQQRHAARQALNVPEDHFCIGSFQKDGHGWGNGLEPKMIKGPDIFLQAIDNIRKQVPVYVLLTGPARGYVKQGLEKIGVPYTHDFLDDFNALPKYFHALDAYLVTSREEGGPKAIMESMCSGVPILTTRVGMAPDLIKDGVNGFLIEIEDTDRLVECALKIATDRPYAQTLTQTALAEIHLYDWSNVARQHWQNIYQPMLEKMT